MFKGVGFALLFAAMIISGAKAGEKSGDEYLLVAFAAALNSASGGGVPGTVLEGYPDKASCERAATSISNPFTVGSASYFHIMFFCVPLH